MGKYAKSATDQQLKDFSDAFENSLLETYASTLVEFKDEKINVLPPSKPQSSPNKARVSIEIVTSTIHILEGIACISTKKVNGKL